MKYSSDDIKKLGTIMGIWAHPDDESWLCAGIMAMAINNGQKVVCITATKGDAGESADEIRWPKANLAEIRETELNNALQILGVKEHYWLDYKDGNLINENKYIAVNKLSKFINSINPDTIFTFGPDGITGHDDHKTIYNWTIEAVQKSKLNCKIFCAIESKEKYTKYIEQTKDKFNIYFNIKKPVTVAYASTDLLFVLPKNIANKKYNCLRTQECQTSTLFSDPDGINLINESCKCECFMQVKSK